MPGDAVDLITMAEVEQELLRLVRAQEKAFLELKPLSQTAAEALADYRVGYAKASLKAGAMTEGSGRGGKPTVDEREAWATVECEALYRARLIAEANRDIKQEALRVIRSNMESLRTMAATLRVMTSG